MYLLLLVNPAIHHHGLGTRFFVKVAQGLDGKSQPGWPTGWGEARSLATRVEVHFDVSESLPSGDVVVSDEVSWIMSG